MNVSDFMLERLHGWGVRRIFGYPGDGINGLVTALARGRDRRLVAAHGSSRAHEGQSEQAKAFASVLFKGDPNEGGILRQALRDMFPTLADKV